MKEKIKKIIKEYIKLINIKFIKRVLIFIILFYIIIFLGILIYSFVFEKDKIAIDRYNFEQLEKVKIVLNGINNYEFNNILEFNSKFNQNIKPIKNCYLFGDKNGFFDENKYNGSFYFGFKLESLIYIYIYKKKYFLYPKYDLPYRSWCESGIGCYDKNKKFFQKIISNPCEE